MDIVENIGNNTSPVHEEFIIAEKPDIEEQNDNQDEEMHQNQDVIVKETLEDDSSPKFSHRLNEQEQINESKDFDKELKDYDKEIKDYEKEIEDLNKKIDQNIISQENSNTEQEKNLDINEAGKTDQNEIIEEESKEDLTIVYENNNESEFDNPDSEVDKNQNNEQSNEIPNNEQEEQPATELTPVTFNFIELGLSANFLELHGIDRTYFNEMPYDFQMDIIFAYMNQAPVNPPTSNAT